MSGVKDQLEIKFRLTDGSDIGPKSFPASASIANLKESILSQWPKAIDLVDEAAAKLKMEITSKPTALDEINRAVLKLEMERLSLTNDTDKASRDRLTRLEAELDLLKERQTELNEQWEHEKTVMARLQSIKEEIDRVNLEIQQAEREYDLNRAAELKYGSLNRPPLNREMLYCVINRLPSLLTSFKRENGPRTVKDVKLISAGRILENNRTVGECRNPLCDVPGGVTTMHVVVQPPPPEKEKKAPNDPKQNKCVCVIL